jgi:outer membrane lipoprotein-sorting protein
MKPAADIERLLQNAELTTNPQTHEKVFQDLLDAQQGTDAHSPAQPEIWRFVMRHPMTKYGVAALIVLAAIVGLSLFKDTGNVAWAIEQSIEAVSKYRAIIIEGSSAERTWDPEGGLELQPIKMWGVANADQTGIEKYRFELDGVTMLVTDGEKTWKYEPQAHRVTIRNRPYVASECSLGSQLLEQLKDFREQGILTRWHESVRRDPATDSQRIVLRIAWEAARWNGPRSVRIEFDRESKLPVSFKQWENADWQGTATLNATTMTHYETLPDEVFTYDIPEGATVIED